MRVRRFRPFPILLSILVASVVALGPGALAGGCCGGCGGERAARGHGHGPGHGPGHGNGSPGRGPGAAGGGGVAASDHDAIQLLLAQHESIQREVRDVEGGVETVTTSEDADLAREIRRHVRRMDERLAAGQGMRHWDPLFVEIFRHHESIRMEIEDIPGGVKVRETSEDPQVVALIRQHARHGVSEFVAEGFARAHRPSPLPEGYAGAAERAEGQGGPPCRAARRAPRL